MISGASQSQLNQELNLAKPTFLSRNVHFAMRVGNILNIERQINPHPSNFNVMVLFINFYIKMTRLKVMFELWIFELLSCCNYMKGNVLICGWIFIIVILSWEGGVY